MCVLRLPMAVGRMWPVARRTNHSECDDQRHNQAVGMQVCEFGGGSGEQANPHGLLPVDGGSADPAPSHGDRIPSPAARVGTMKLVVLGATGGVALEVVKQAIDRGHSVTALVRSPERLEPFREPAMIIKGDLMNCGELAQVGLTMPRSRRWRPMQRSACKGSWVKRLKNTSTSSPPTMQRSCNQYLRWNQLFTLCAPRAWPREAITRKTSGMLKGSCTNSTVAGMSCARQKSERPGEPTTIIGGHSFIVRARPRIS